MICSSTHAQKLPPNEQLKLETLHFYNNMSGDDGCVAWARIISRCSSLVDVRFSGTRASRVGSLAASKALSGNASLGGVRRLDLADNTFGGEGGIRLCEAIGRMQELESVDLRDCSMEDEGIKVSYNRLNGSNRFPSFLVH